MSYEDIENKLDRKIAKYERFNIFPLSLIVGFFLRKLYEEREEHEELRKENKDHYNFYYEQVKRNLDNLETRLANFQKNNVKKAKYEDIQSGLDNTYEILEELILYKNDDYLKYEELSSIDELKDELSDLKINFRREFNKQIFDTRISKIKDDFRKLNQIIEPYINLKRYLEKEKKKIYLSDLKGISNDLTYLPDKVFYDELSNSQINEYRGLEDRLTKSIEKIKNQNRDFIEKQIKKYESLFSNIDGSGHDLNRSQKEAIIKNDKNNLVIAAAGTGKTLVLTYRIAYLIEEGVDSEQILAMTFTKKASKEMKERLKSNFDIDDVEIRTIHSKGFEITNNHSKMKLDGADDNYIRNKIDEVFHKEQETDYSNFITNYTKYLKSYYDDFPNRADFKTKKEYIQDRKKRRYTTLKGEKVESIAEKKIADFLFTNKIDYRYEEVASWADSSEEKRVYQPDFFLPDDKLYIEHWGIDESGQAPPWFNWSTENYVDKIKWAREQFSKNEENDLIETYDFEHSDLDFEKVLRYRLSSNGVELNNMSYSELINSFYEYDKTEKKIMDTFLKFINKVKTYKIDRKKIQNRLDPKKPKQYYFGKCALKILEMYDVFLKRDRKIDFNDMIWDAVEITGKKPNRYNDKYEHILVDEFQDVSENQVEFIRNLRGENTKLFCVGDDWQSIYSFRGANPKYFFKFEDYFGDYTKTDLTENFRSHKSILDAGNKLIKYNKKQIKKLVRTNKVLKKKPWLHKIEADSDFDYIHKTVQKTLSILDDYNENNVKYSDIMVLCRFDEGLDFLEKVKGGLRYKKIPYRGKMDKYPKNKETENRVQIYSIHQAKGKEAKHVIILHFSECINNFNFPIERETLEELGPVTVNNYDQLEEERRLAYVGITRAKEDLHIITRDDYESTFVKEMKPHIDLCDIENILGDFGDRVTIKAKVEEVWDNTDRKYKQRGRLKYKFNIVEFIIWPGKDKPYLREGRKYKISNAVINKYKGRKQIKLDKKTEVNKI